MVEIFIDEIDLTLAGDLSGFGDPGRAARVDDGALDDAKPAAVHSVLCRGSSVFHDVAVFAHELIETVLTDVHTVLIEQLREFADEDLVGSVGDGVCEEDFGSIGGDFLLSLDTGGAFIFEVGCEADDGIRVGKDLLGEFMGEVGSMLTDGRDDIVGDPTFELTGFGFTGTEDKGIQARLGNKVERLSTTTLPRMTFS